MIECHFLIEAVCIWAVNNGSVFDITILYRTEEAVKLDPSDNCPHDGKYKLGELSSDEFAALLALAAGLEQPETVVKALYALIEPKLKDCPPAARPIP